MYYLNLNTLVAIPAAIALSLSAGFGTNDAPKTPYETDNEQYSTSITMYTHSYVNVRECPDSWKCEIIESLPIGTPVTIDNSETDDYSTKTSRGWISTALLGYEPLPMSPYYLYYDARIGADIEEWESWTSRNLNPEQIEEMDYYCKATQGNGETCAEWPFHSEPLTRHVVKALILFC